MEALGDLPLLG